MQSLQCMVCKCVASSWPIDVSVVTLSRRTKSFQKYSFSSGGLKGAESRHVTQRPLATWHCIQTWGMNQDEANVGLSILIDVSIYMWSSRIITLSDPDRWKHRGSKPMCASNLASRSSHSSHARNDCKIRTPIASQFFAVLPFMLLVEEAGQEHWNWYILVSDHQSIFVMEAGLLIDSYFSWFRGRVELKPHKASLLMLYRFFRCDRWPNETPWHWSMMFEFDLCWVCDAVQFTRPRQVLKRMCWQACPWDCEIAKEKRVAEVWQVTYISACGPSFCSFVPIWILREDSWICSWCVKVLQRYSQQSLGSGYRSGACVCVCVCVRFCKPENRNGAVSETWKSLTALWPSQDESF